MAALIENIYDKIAGEKTVPTSTPAHPILDETTKMHALVWNGKEDMRYQEVPKPLLTDPRDILLRVTSSSICGSDLHLYSGMMKGMKSGDIVGHEFMGVIEEVGKDVHKLRVGQRVVVAFDIACGSCEYCKRELYTACDTTNPSKATEEMYGHRTGSFYGYSHITGGVPGGQSEYVRVSFAEMNCLPIPDDVPDEKALFLSDLVPTAYHGTELANVKEGDIVGIWGLGPIGLLAAKWCFIRKAKMVIGVDCIPERMELAKKIGVHVIDFSKGDAVKEIFNVVPGGLDSAIECAGFEYPSTWLHKVEIALSLETDTADILTQCITTVKKCGIVSIIGVYTGYTNHFPIGALMEKGLTMNGGQSPTQKYWKMALEKIQSGELDPTFVVTHTGSLADGPELYKKFYKREDGIIKVFLQPESMARKEATQS